MIANVNGNAVMISLKILRGEYRAMRFQLLLDHKTDFRATHMVILPWVIHNASTNSVVEHSAISYMEHLAPTELEICFLGLGWV
jgi:hypothetical protein